MDNSRVAVFIDHSNVLHNLIDNIKIDSKWVRWYCPLTLSRKLCGNRNLTRVYFYCSPPPAFLLRGSDDKKDLYWKQTSYYEAIKKLPDVELKYGNLTGSIQNLCEKNLDTQLSVDMIMNASKNAYDVAILISNDGDFVSAVQGVKELGRKVELVYFKGRVSMNLSRLCDIKRRARRSFFERLDFTQTTQSL